jgi:hypothetical protein
MRQLHQFGDERGSEQTASLSDVDRLELGVRSEFAEDVLNVIADGRSLNAEGLGDVFRAYAAGHQAEHLSFAPRQSRRRRHRLAFSRNESGSNSRGIPLRNSICTEIGSPIDRLHQVYEVEAARSRTPCNDDRAFDFDRLPREVFDLEYIRMNGLVVAQHFSHGTAVVAVTVSEQIAAANHLVAALAKYARSGVAQ